MKKWVNRVGWALRWAWRLQPLTAAGWALGAAAGLAYHHYGRGEADFVLLSASLFALAVLSAATLFVVLATARVLWALRGQGAMVLERQVDAEMPFESGWRAPALRWWPFVELSSLWESPAAVDVTLRRAEGWLLEDATPRERARVSEVRRLVTVRDIFGLSAVRFPQHQAASLRVSPRRGRADVGLAVRNTTGEGFAHPRGAPEGDLVEMRRYAPGDPLRMVLWKHYARTRQMLVRMPERAMTPRPSTAAYFVAGPGDEATAATARLFVERGLLGESFVFSADGAAASVQTPEEAVDTIIDSVRFRPTGGEGLSHFLRNVDPAQRDNCVLFVPGNTGPWLDAVLRAVSSLRVPPTVIVGVDGSLSPARQTRRARFVFAMPEEDRAVEALPSVYRSLRALGGPVRVIHRDSGRVVREADLLAVGGLPS
jgi:hypothetical protein